MTSGAGPGERSPSGAGAQRARRGLAAMLLLAALGALALATLGASADRGDLILSEGSGPTVRTPPPPESEEYSEPDWSVYEMPTRPPTEQGGSRPVGTLLLVLAAVVAALVLLALVLRMRALVRPSPQEAEEVPEDELSEEQAGAALAEARERLALDVDPHDAVVAAWLALEAAISRAGITRAPSQTTLEFVVAVLGTVSLDRTALDRLAHLYRRALFDDAPLGEQDREEAVAQLDLLARQLRERTP
ncbi:DUF4129 domain-containing protein [Brachybacterium sp. YJGR34]|uniref:DUF4129 domain-containing protein n=1 Tax=Brachybacterium sp. YJGR34 TaxID=2059911 RepID=UPI000E0A31E4|nr:DUF4129 domain-containing protein [Brachybacterium sp. YJGR34]